MNKDRQILFKQVCDAWDNDSVACHLYLARLYSNKYPDEAFGWYATGRAFLAMARYREAATMFGRARKVAKEDEVAYVCLQFGNLYDEKGDLARAEKWYQKAVQCNISNPRNFVFLGACLAAQGKYAEAKEAHRAAISKKADTTDEAYYNLGMIFRAEENYDSALECFAKAAELDPIDVKYKRALQDIVDFAKLQKGS
jgi:tetratricopeptide (TPR) repeat protein